MLFKKLSFHAVVFVFVNSPNVDPGVAINLISNEDGFNLS